MQAEKAIEAGYYCKSYTEDMAYQQKILQHQIRICKRQYKSVVHGTSTYLDISIECFNVASIRTFTSGFLLYSV